jgi:hypothetical protein
MKPDSFNIWGFFAIKMMSSEKNCPFNVLAKAASETAKINTRSILRLMISFAESNITYNSHTVLSKPYNEAWKL